MYTAELALNGLAIGCATALAALGLITTYRLTGVFNLAFGAVAMLTAYLQWEAVRGWHVPVAVAAPVDIFVVAPGIGLLLDAGVFRALRRRGAASTEQLVAALGVFVLVVGGVVLVWGGQTRLDPPPVLPSGSVRFGQLYVTTATLWEVGIVAALALLLTVVLRATRLGLWVRAVVDNRRLAGLAGVPTERLTAAGWAFGCMLAGLTGVLLAPAQRFDPYGLTLIVLETMGVAIAARLASLPVAVLLALALGVGQSELTQLSLPGTWNELVGALRSNFFVVVLFVALLVVQRLSASRGAANGDTPPGSESGAAIRVARRANRLTARDDGGKGGMPPVGEGHHVGTPPLRTPRGGAAPLGLADGGSQAAGVERLLLVGGLALLLLLPLAFDPADLRAAQAVPALAVVLVSLVVVTGYGGQVSLGQTGFAGLGALLAGRLADGTLFGLGHVPWLVAMFLGPLLVVPIGFVTGWPAIRRRGLYLALTTFAIATMASRFVFEQPGFTAGLTIGRPGPFAGDHLFYVLELGCLTLALLLVNAVRTGPLGRSLFAMRDSEAGARASGIDVARMKVFVFALSAGLAGLGGALSTMATQAFDPTTYDPIQGLVWLAAVVVCGVDSVTGAVAATAAIVALDTGVTAGASTFAIGVGAVLLGRMPDGLSGLVRRLTMPRPRPATPVAGRLTPAGREVAARIAAVRVSTNRGGGE